MAVFKQGPNLGPRQSLLILIWILPVVFAAEDLCWSESCNQTAEYLLQSLNSTVNPCEDFYEFACGGWMAKHDLPPTEVKINVFQKLSKQVLDEVRSTLDSMVELDDRTIPNSVRFAKYLFGSCQNGLYKLEKVAFSYFFQFFFVENDEQINEYLHKALSWSIGQQDNRFQSWWQQIVDAHQFGIQPLFVLFTSQDEMHSKKHVFKVFKANFMFKDNIFLFE